MFELRLTRDDGKELLILITDKKADQLIDLMYPDNVVRKDALGYISLVNFVHNHKARL